MAPQRTRWGAAGAEPAVDAAGLRMDGRRPSEIRVMRCVVGEGTFSPFGMGDDAHGPTGSAYVEQGRTAVLATVYGPRERASSSSALPGSTGALVNCEFAITALNVGGAASAGSSYTKADRRSSEMAASIKAAFETVIVGDGLQRSQIDVFVHVLQSDGGQLAAAINATSLALMNAGIPLLDVVCACTVGVVDAYYLADVTALEMRFHGAVLTVASTPSEHKIVLLELESKLPNQDTLDNALSVAQAGCQEVYHAIDDAMHAYFAAVHRAHAPIRA
ncbi:Exosome complex component RRP41 [Porphyridium purpureum]|uniref:Exosome complex component RRP41 n=1 Tax=Porphyridium purpureum TaxID=35688 RepID=A0A5J4YW46_PORPP|nr:Exosome complex component RRP41 [Porphyridium purpureum]|eukprot:POR5377..scf209_3